MTRIHVRVVDMAGNTSVLPLPDDSPLNDLLPALITLLHLSSDLPYRLFSPRMQQVLGMNGTLYSNGIINDDMLRVVSISKSFNFEMELLDDPEPGARLPLPHQPRITIGRSSDNDLVIRDNSISREHGELVWRDGLHIYRDLNSANGSFINHQVVSEPMPISPGSILRLGDSIRLIYQEAPSAFENPSENAESRGQDSSTITELNPLPQGLVFLSYHRQDVTLMQKLAEHLRENGFHIFWEAEIPADSNIQEAINNGIHVSDALVALVTTDSVATASISNQWNAFYLTRKPMIGVMYQQGEVPHIFKDHVTIEFEGDFNHLMNQVTHQLKHLIR